MLEKSGNKTIIKSAILLLGVILLFTFIDYFFHGFSAAWTVPDYYFRNKIIFGFLYGAVPLFLSLKIRKSWARPLVFSLVLSAALQTRYFIEGYELNFVVTFFFIHFLILYVLAIPMFYFLEKTIREGEKQ